MTKPKRNLGGQMKRGIKHASAAALKAYTEQHVPGSIPWKKKECPKNPVDRIMLEITSIANLGTPWTSLAFRKGVLWGLSEGDLLDPGHRLDLLAKLKKVWPDADVSNPEATSVTSRR